jgi:hypothetical protein
MLLVLIFIGIPAATHRQIWQWQISSKETAEKLMFWGLAVGIVLNILAATLFPSGIKTKEACAKWTFVFGGLLLLEYAFIQGYLNFDWLKKVLLRLQKLF